MNICRSGHHAYVRKMTDLIEAWGPNRMVEKSALDRAAAVAVLLNPDDQVISHHYQRSFLG